VYKMIVSRNSDLDSLFILGWSSSKLRNYMKIVGKDAFYKEYPQFFGMSSVAILERQQKEYRDIPN